MPKATTQILTGPLPSTTDTAAAAQSEVVVVVIPLLVDEHSHPVFGWMDAATQATAQGLKPGTIVSYESILPLGPICTRCAPMVEQGSGLVAGEGFHHVFSPERVLTGRVFADLRKHPKLAGGIDPASEERGMAFYESVLDFDARDELPKPNGVWPMGSAEAAEMAKLAETTYRDVNIGLASQFAKFADKSGIDAYAVIEACNSQPYSHIDQPGSAVGGHCIPVYPRLHLHNDPEATIVREGANASMPEYAVQRFAEAHGDFRGARVAVLGVAYRVGLKRRPSLGCSPWWPRSASAGPTSASTIRCFLTPNCAGTARTLPPRRPLDAAILEADHLEYAELESSALPGAVVLNGRRTLSCAVPSLAIGEGSRQSA